MKAGASSVLSIRLRLLLAEVFTSVEAMRETWKEIDHVEVVLKDGVYKQIPYGWFFWQYIKTQKMTSLFKTSLYPEQQKTIKEWEQASAETHYEPPIWKVKAILIEISLDPSKVTKLEDYSKVLIDLSKQTPFIGTEHVIELSQLMEAFFKFPE